MNDPNRRKRSSIGEQEEAGVSEEEVVRLEHELMILSRHPAMDSIADGRDTGADRLERSAYILMSRIEQTGPMSIGQLSEAFGLDTSTVNRQTAAMLRAGLVERIPDPDGGIARKFRITPHGMDRLRRHRSWTTAGLQRVLADWDPEEIRDLIRSLTCLNTSIERLQQRHGQLSRDPDPER